MPASTVRGRTAVVVYEELLQQELPQDQAVFIPQCKLWSLLGYRVRERWSVDSPANWLSLSQIMMLSSSWGLEITLFSQKSVLTLPKLFPLLLLSSHRVSKGTGVFFSVFACTPCSSWDLSSLTRDWTRALSSESVESEPLDRQGSPGTWVFCV